MAAYDDYELERPLSENTKGQSVVLVRRKGTADGPSQVIRQLIPPSDHIDESGRLKAIEGFSESATLQKSVAETSQYWARIDLVESLDTGIYLLSDYYDRSVQWLIDLSVRLSHDDLYQIFSAIACGLADFHERHGRGHGNLIASRVLIGGTEAVARCSVVLNNPVPQSLLGEDSTESDVFQAGQILHQLLTGLPYQDGWSPFPVRATDKSLCKNPAGWLRLCNQLLNPDLGQRIRTAEKFRQGVERLRGSSVPKKSIACAALLAAGAFMAVYFWTQHVSQQRQAVRISGQWRQLCEEYERRNWSKAALELSDPETQKHLAGSNDPRLANLAKAISENGVKSDPRRIFRTEEDYRTLKDHPFSSSDLNQMASQVDAAVSEINTLRALLPDDNWPLVKRLDKAAESNPQLKSELEPIESDLKALRDVSATSPISKKDISLLLVNLVNLDAQYAQTTREVSKPTTQEDQSLARQQQMQKDIGVIRERAQHWGWTGVLDSLDNLTGDLPAGWLAKSADLEPKWVALTKVAADVKSADTSLSSLLDAVVDTAARHVNLTDDNRGLADAGTLLRSIAGFVGEKAATDAEYKSLVGQIAKATGIGTGDLRVSLLYSHVQFRGEDADGFTETAGSLEDTKRLLIHTRPLPPGSQARCDEVEKQVNDIANGTWTQRQRGELRNSLEEKKQALADLRTTLKRVGDANDWVASLHKDPRHSLLEAYPGWTNAVEKLKSDASILAIAASDDALAAKKDVVRDWSEQLVDLDGKSRTVPAWVDALKLQSRWTLDIRTTTAVAFDTRPQTNAAALIDAVTQSEFWREAESISLCFPVIEKRNLTKASDWDDAAAKWTGAQAVKKDSDFWKAQVESPDGALYPLKRLERARLQLAALAHVARSTDLQGDVNAGSKFVSLTAGMQLLAQNNWPKSPDEFKKADDWFASMTQDKFDAMTLVDQKAVADQKKSAWIRFVANGSDKDAMALAADKAADFGVDLTKIDELSATLNGKPRAFYNMLVCLVCLAHQGDKTMVTGELLRTAIKGLDANAAGIAGQAIPRGTSDTDLLKAVGNDDSWYLFGNNFNPTHIKPKHVPIG